MLLLNPSFGLYFSKIYSFSVMLNLSALETFPVSKSPIFLNFLYCKYYWICRSVSMIATTNTQMLLRRMPRLIFDKKIKQE